MNSKTLISIIVLNWNGENFIKQCLESLMNQTYSHSDYEIIVVDNSSTDKSIDIIKNEFPSVKLIINKKNYGFAKGNNIGIKFAKGEIISLINNDVIVSKKWLEKLVSGFLEESDASLASGTIYFYKPSNIIWSTGARFDLITGLQWHPAKYKKVLEHNEEIDFFPFCATLIKKEVFNKIGLLDEQFFIYSEDFDFCLRAKNAGFKLKFVPDAIVWHMVSMGAKHNLLFSSQQRLISDFKVILKLWPILFLPFTISLRLLVIPFIEVILFKLPFKKILLTWKAFCNAIIENKRTKTKNCRIDLNIMLHYIRFFECIKIAIYRYKQIKHISSISRYLF